ncbi:MAG: WXG100 family type VII secretion target [Anaerolineales bacterium]|nr:WXG100 family type VII secretion target [Anaerolineales bacterium]
MHMNVENVTAVKDLMEKDQEKIDEMIKTLTAAINGLEEGAWVGYSATQFFQDYETMNMAMKRQLEIMRIFAERFEAEINEWEHVAETFG